MKSLRTIIIAGIVLVVFVVASIIVTHIPSSSTASDSSAEAETSSASASTETVYVVNRDYSTLTGFEVVPTEREVTEDTSYAYASESLSVTINREEVDGTVNYAYDVAPDPGKFEYNSSMFRSMMYTLTSISAKTLVEEDAKDLSMYGLDQPTAVVKTYYEDGSELDIIIGSMAPVDNDYYCKTSDSNAVYTIGSYVDSLLVRRPIEYRDITLFPTYEEDDIYTNINWVCMTGSDGSVIEILLDSNLDNEYNTESSQYVMLQPYQVSGNTSTIQSNMLDIVATLTLGSIIDDITEDDYAEYGLNKSTKLEMTDISGNELHLIVGKTCPNPDYTYAMLEGTDVLLTINSAAVTCLNDSYVQYMLRTVWSYNIENLKSIDIQIGDTAYDLQATHYIKQNANGNDTDGVHGTLNGTEIIETNVRRLFVRSLYFRIIGDLTEDEIKTAEKTAPYATITIHLEDESHTLELIPITDRKYAMSVDGKMEYYCYKKSLETLEKSLGYVLEGDELPLSFD